MKILAVGDFHGKFPSWINTVIKKEKIDIVISVGDFFPFIYRKEWFKYCYGKDVELWEIIGKEKMRKLILKDLKMGEDAIKKLNELSVPVVSVFGNLDHGKYNDQHAEEKISKGKSWKWADQDFFSKIIKKYRNIKMIDYSYFKFEDWIFIGARGGTNVGHVQSKIYRKHKERLNELFWKFRKENKQSKIVFVSHNVPYDTKLDKIGKHAHKKVRGKHLGSKLIRRTITKWQPVLHIGGHIHEGKGKDKLGKTTIVNSGAVHDGEFAIIEIAEKGKSFVRFIKKN